MRGGPPPKWRNADAAQQPSKRQRTAACNAGPSCKGLDAAQQGSTRDAKIAIAYDAGSRKKKTFRSYAPSDLHDRLVAKCKSTMGAGSLDFEMDGYGYTIDCSRNLQIAYHTRYTRQIRVHTVATVGFILITQLRQPPLEGVRRCVARAGSKQYSNNPDSTPSIPTAPRTAPQQHSSGTAGTYRH